MTKEAPVIQADHELIEIAFKALNTADACLGDVADGCASAHRIPLARKAIEEAFIAYGARPRIASLPTPAHDEAMVERLTRPIIGIENRTAQEAFDIMADRIRSAALKSSGMDEAIESVISKWERGENHNEGAFDPDCETCLILADLRLALANLRGPS